ncbi:hypothetical protein [Sporosarcina sp. SAFN-015]|uniref:hypothetical protein n=1 Tax=Sporosarcina sp. SAFN-015 TaxID=3387274 RepID=UPI003F80A158
MIKSKDLIVKLAIKNLQLEAREKALLNILAEKEIIDLESYYQTVESSYLNGESIKEPYKELLELSEEEFQAIDLLNKS